MLNLLEDNFWRALLITTVILSTVLYDEYGIIMVEGSYAEAQTKIWEHL